MHLPVSGMDWMHVEQAVSHFVTGAGHQDNKVHGTGATMEALAWPLRAALQATLSSALPCLALWQGASGLLQHCRPQHTRRVMQRPSAHHAAHPSLHLAAHR